MVIVMDGQILQEYGPTSKKVPELYECKKCNALFGILTKVKGECPKCGTPGIRVTP